eukprot:Nk52_evm24s152 gene=Nk52_evmTU24s152
MPALVLFRRRWQVGSDDLLLPACAGACLRGVWFGAMLGSYLSAEDEYSCGDSEDDLEMYVYGILAIYGLLFCNDLLLAFLSTRGTILEVRKRKGSIPLLYMNTTLSLLEIAWTCYGTALMWGDDLNCSGKFNSIVNRIKGIVISNWVLIGLQIIFTLCAYDSVGGGLKDSRSEIKWKLKNRREYEKLWENRCRLMCCYVGTRGQDSNAYAEIAKIFANIFMSVDVVPTDVAAGLVLVRNLQKAEEIKNIQRLPNAPPGRTLYYQRTERSKSLQMASKTADSQFLLLVAHFVKYAIGAYGWMLFARMHFLTSPCRFRLCGCTCCSDPVNARNNGDNCFNCNYAAMKLQTGLDDDDIIFTNFENEIFKSPYYIAFDHETKSVVISIRGTLSLEDCITDAVAECEPFGVPGVEEAFAHRGMAKIARKLFIEIKSKGILEEVMRPGTEYSAYELVVVGHSLGAGVATLLCILLRSDCFPKAKCIAYSPPGATLSLEACEIIKPFVTSVVLGKDMIPRMSLQAINTLRDDMVHAIANCKRGKWGVISGGCFCFHQETDFFYKPGDKHSEESMLLLDSYRKARSQIKDPPIRLHCPGKILHIVKTYTDKNFFMTAARIYNAVWAHNEDFLKILVSPLMYQDHMPDEVMKVLQDVADSIRVDQEYHGHRPFVAGNLSHSSFEETSYPYYERRGAREPEPSSSMVFGGDEAV